MQQSLGRQSLGQLDFVTGFETTALAGCHLAALPLHQRAAYAPLAEYSCITAAVRPRDLVFQSISFRAEVVTGQKSKIARGTAHACLLPRMFIVW
jgi:hypothetical protein